MSALAWLFGVGALAVAFPFLFHLIRRTPRGQTEFSSLMFLKPTPPTLSKRSRLENILLLLIRAAAICLIAMAFMRPFFRGSDTLSAVELANRRVAILLDTSASMRRSGLWEQAKQQVENALQELEPGDDVALLTFDSTVKPMVSFENGTGEKGTDRAKLVRNALKTIEPTWSRSDLGGAMVSVADSLDVWRDSQRAKDAKAISNLQMVVVSDLQKGSKIDALQSYQWPAHVLVKFQTVVPADPTNATVQLLEPDPEEEDPALRVRVANSEESNVEQFFVRWSSAEGGPGSDPASFYVPPGTSRVLKIARDEAVQARNFVVTGDVDDFDNTFFVVPNQQQNLNIVYVGNDEPDDPEHLQYYLRRALIETPSRAIHVQQLMSGETISDMVNGVPTIAFVTSAIHRSQREEIDAYLDSGGTVLVVLTDQKSVESTAGWTGARSKPSEEGGSGSKSDYLMLAEIDFTHQLFQPFANPRYNDFTKVRFWKHQPVELLDDQSIVIARFENGDPAVWSRTMNSGGKVFVLASGWQPRQSQLALSSKFVPLVNGLVEIAADFPELDNSILVDEFIEFPAAENERFKRTMIKPDGSREVVDAGQTRFVGADQPGIYRLVSINPSGQDGSIVSSDPDSSSTTTELLFAANVDRAESETSAIPVSQIEMFEVQVGEQVAATSELAQMREMRDRDIEDRQKIWKWLILAAIVLLIIETWLAGRTGLKTVAEETVIPSSGLSGELS